MCLFTAFYIGSIQLLINSYYSSVVLHAVLNYKSLDDVHIPLAEDDLQKNY